MPCLAASGVSIRGRGLPPNWGVEPGCTSLFRATLTAFFTVRNIEQLVLADGMSQAVRLCPQVVRKVVALERRKTALKANVDEYSGQNTRKDECSKGIKVATWRPDN
jgi:hypothetical protein